MPGVAFDVNLERVKINVFYYSFELSVKSKSLKSYAGTVPGLYFCYLFVFGCL